MVWRELISPLNEINLSECLKIVSIGCLNKAKIFLECQVLKRVKIWCRDWQTVTSSAYILSIFFNRRCKVEIEIFKQSKLAILDAALQIQFFKSKSRYVTGNIISLKIVLYEVRNQDVPLILRVVELIEVLTVTNTVRF
jgi:hypothetical protein